MAILYLILQIKRDKGSATEWIRTGILCEIPSEFGVRSGVTFMAFKAFIGRPWIVGQEVDFKNQDRLAGRLPKWRQC
jgi:hypothetical protein